MLDPKQPLASYIGRPKVRVVTEDGKRVIAWGNVLPTTEDGSKRQEAAVCASFTQMGLVITDFMIVQDFNHVMGGNGPPRYNKKTGYYYDYGAFPDGHPSGVLICTDDSLLVAKSIRDGRPKKDDVTDDDPPLKIPGAPEGSGDDDTAGPKRAA